ncbi:MAG: hypothetical protein GC155_13025 [Alphaproteobacteria bacterium]|nr:hypothetical protein [Alphaproteobacteria bacterium]
METGRMDGRIASSDPVGEAGLATRRPTFAILGVIALGVYAIVGGAFACDGHFPALSLGTLVHIATLLGAGLAEGADEGAGPV